MLITILAFLSQTPHVEPRRTDQEIIVIGDRLRRWTGKYEGRGTRMKCSTRKSTGDAEIDAIGCAAFQTCADRLQPRILATDAKGLSKAMRKQMKDAVKTELAACVQGQRDQMVAALADRRFDARPGSD